MKKKFILSIAVIVAAVTSCKKLDDLNVNEKAATKVPSETLFANGLRNLVDQITTPSNNFNVLRLFTQYWAGVTYIDETKYDLVARPIPANEFITVYRDVLADLKESKRVIATESSAVSSDAVKKNKTAITEIVSVYAFHREVNIFGNIPYEEALDPDKINPKYDNAQSIYAALFSRLDAAIASIDVNAAGFSKASDLLYGGDMKKWKLFAAGLKVKMAICVADVPSLDPGGKITSAMATGLFTSPADDAAFAYASSAPNTNPVWANIVAADRRDWVAANTIVDIMNNLSDPRRSKFFADNIKDGAGNVKYVGGIYGSQNGYTACTQMSPTIQLANRKANLLEYTEIQFYLAEAAARSLIAGNAEDFYVKGITASFQTWGITDTATVNPYLRQDKVKYSSTASGATYKQKIGTQSYIAFYDRGEPAWNNWRRLDFPIFNPPKGMTQADIPVRYIYPGVEQTLNGANYTEAAAAIGGDFKSTKLFWDKF
jgi:hypothetical protein